MSQKELLPALTADDAALTEAGVGFGAQGSKPGAFYTFAPPPASATVALSGTSPQ